MTRDQLRAAIVVGVGVPLIAAGASGAPTAQQPPSFTKFRPNVTR